MSFASCLEASAQDASSPTGTFITSSGEVKIYTLPSKLQAVVEGDDDKYYAINYYTWSDDSGDKIPGISLGQWWTDEKIKQFFPWGNDEVLAEKLAAGYRDFATASNNNLLEDNGDLKINGYENGGGFIFGNWDNNTPPPGVEQRPKGDTKKKM